MNRCAAICFALSTLVGCAPMSIEVLPVTRLAPPEEVRASITAGEIDIQWQQPACCSADLAGYAIYISRRSLILAPLQELPVPVRVAANQRHYRAPAGEQDGKLFVHIRSMSHSGKVSLPSLPETVVLREN